MIVLNWCKKNAVRYQFSQVDKERQKFDHAGKLLLDTMLLDS